MKYREDIIVLRNKNHVTEHEKHGTNTKNNYTNFNGIKKKWKLGLMKKT